MRFSSRGNGSSGAEWDRDATDRAIVERVVGRLNDKGALTDAYSWEVWSFVNESIDEIRHMLSDALDELRPETEAYRLLEQLRTACRTYLRTSGPPTQSCMPRDAAVALTDLRETFRVTLSYFAQGGKLPIAEQLLARIRPVVPPAE
jgi:hypothetical protein